jgi:hypothetical protein
MYNQMGEDRRKAGLTSLVESGGFIFSDFFYTNSTTGDDDDDNILHDDYAAPLLNLYFPVIGGGGVPSTSSSSNGEGDEVVGALDLEIGVEFLFERALVGNANEPMTVTVDTSCGSQFSFRVQDQKVTFLGRGDIHDTIPSVGGYDLVATTFEQFDEIVTSETTIFPAPNDSVCSYKILVYPTLEFYDYTISNRPILVQAGVGLVFLFTVSAFNESSRSVCVC